MKCKYCESENLIEIPKPPHIGLYCKDCKKWLKWLKQEENIETGEVATDSQQKYALSLMTKWKHSGKPMTMRQAGAIISAFKI